MRAVTYAQTGQAEQVLRVLEMARPSPAAGEVLVRIAASGINPADVKRRAGWGGMQMGHPVVIPHCDGAGTIEAVGDGVSAARVGQRVWLWNAQGGYGEAGRAFGTAAEYIALPETQAVPLPDHFTLEQGACLGVPAMTAFHCVLSEGPVEGKTILVQGGAGSVGYLAVQIALKEGACVLATVSDPDAAARLRTLGAEAINRHQEDVAEAVEILTGRRGVDRIVEVDFAANQRIDARMINVSGSIASFSSSSNPTPVLDYYAFASKGATVRFVQGFALPNRVRARGEIWLAGHQIEIPIAARFPLDRCAEAHRHVEKSRAFGQTVVIP